MFFQWCLYNKVTYKLFFDETDPRRSLSQSGGIATSPWVESSPTTGLPLSAEQQFVKLPQPVHLYPFIHLDGERYKTTTQGPWPVLTIRAQHLPLTTKKRTKLSPFPDLINTMIVVESLDTRMQARRRPGKGLFTARKGRGYLSKNLQ